MHTLGSCRDSFSRKLSLFPNVAFSFCSLPCPWFRLHLRWCPRGPSTTRSQRWRSQWCSRPPWPPCSWGSRSRCWPASRWGAAAQGLHLTPCLCSTQDSACDKFQFLSTYIAFSIVLHCCFVFYNRLLLISLCYLATCAQNISKRWESNFDVGISCLQVLGGAAFWFGPFNCNSVEASVKSLNLLRKESLWIVSK